MGEQGPVRWAVACSILASCWTYLVKQFLVLWEVVIQWGARRREFLCVQTERGARGLREVSGHIRLRG